MKRNMIQIVALVMASAMLVFISAGVFALPISPIGGGFTEDNTVKLNSPVNRGRSESASASTCNIEPCASCTKNTAENIAGIGMSNPAAMYCKEMGYEYRVVATEEGERGVVVFPNGEECDEWDFYEGRCGQEFSYCAKQGWLIAPKGKKDNFSNKCVACVMPDGTQKSVSELLDLETKINIGTIVASEAKATRAGIDTVLDTNDMEPVASLPTHFDWRDNDGDWMTPVKDQENCGSCWAFSAVGASEPQFNISSGNPDLNLDLSEQYLVSDCCENCGDCGGGWHNRALVFIRDSGITDEDCFPYTAHDSLCTKCSGWASRLKTIDETARVPNDIEVIKQYLIDKGPLSVAMGVGGGGSFDNDGIYRCTNDNSVNHAVVIVGYDEGGDYWIVKNSWGSTWNGNGYFNVGCGECGIENYVYYAYNAATGVPEADFYGVPTNGYVPLVVNFTDQSSSSDGIATWAWSFGDGGTSNEQSPVHTYEGAGVYTVSLTVSEGDGDSDTETKIKYITVSEVVDFVDQGATGEVNVAGSVSGYYGDTQENYGSVEAITERQSGGKPSIRYSYLEHKWLFDVQEGKAVIFNGNTWAPTSNDGDSFVFSYSTDDTSYSEMFTVIATEDDDIYQTFTLPPFTSGTVYIRATDTDQGQGNLELNTLHIDHMFIRTVFVSDPPSAAENLTAAPLSSSSIGLTWDDNADNENGFKIERSADGSGDWASIDIVPTDTVSYTDTGLEAATTYYYRVLAFNDYGDSGPSSPAYATTDVGISMHVSDLNDDSSLANRNRWNAVVIITVNDEVDSPVEGATVIGSWSAGAAGSSSGITDGSGQCSITKGNLKSNVNSVTFTVEDVTLAGYTYVADDNDDPDDDSDGTTITLSKP